jgi:hypothetical protein
VFDYQEPAFNFMILTNTTEMSHLKIDSYHPSDAWTSDVIPRFPENLCPTVNYFGPFHSLHSSSQSLPFIPTKHTQYVKYIYLSPVTSYMFRCLLHSLQGDHCFTCSKAISVLKKAYVVPGGM